MRTVLAVDGGNSKTDVALFSLDGRLLAAVRGPSISHQAVGLEASMVRLCALVADVHRGAELAPDPVAELGVFALAGADTLRDVRALKTALAGYRFAERQLVRNDADAALRAGTDRGWGVVVICGSGVGAAGVARDGRTARLAALGPISGDWGGGSDIGWAGVAAAVRARDGRGPGTRLAADIPAHFGLRNPRALTAALYDGRIGERRIGELSPIVFAAAEAGDRVARDIVDRLADEVVAMAGAMLRRLHLLRLDPDVVLGGGVFRTRDDGFHDRIRSGVTAIAPGAHVIRLETPPVAGAGLIGLDALGVAGVGPAVRMALAAWDREGAISRPR